ncbi:FAD/NAD(P)-binding protein [Novosphingobium panipatense]
MTSAIAVRDLPVAVIGGGFSGTLLAINLLRYGVKVILIERSSAQLAKGVAFGTRRPEHLLNVRASNMSAFPDDAGHFLRWMHFSDADEANRFVPRLSYGTYLRELLVQALAKAGKDARIVDGEACAIERVDSHARVKLANGSILPAAPPCWRSATSLPCLIRCWKGCHPTSTRPTPGIARLLKAWRSLKR